uniref:Pheromone receptor n=1 Tax=Lentinula edodes TaxID=5353 RepID=V9M2E3_LENED|nr:pheromone receptor [Lentinula edodes]AGC14667.1 pheromone receptor [Lentinula edodes]
MQLADPTFPLFPTFAFLGFVLCLIPLSWHLQAWNSGTCAFMIWVGCLCLVEFINSLIWSDNAINSVPIWCDICSQIIAGAGVGIPASILCISRRLYRIISLGTMYATTRNLSRYSHRGWFTPASTGAAYVSLIGPCFLYLTWFIDIIVQPHRFNILEVYGCSPATYNTLPAYFLFYMWPVLIGLASFIYSSGLTLRTFYIRRIQFNHILASNSAINPSRYLRLMLLALIDILCTIPIGIYIIYIDLKGVPLAPWISWDDTHFDFGRVVLIPAVVWRADPATTAGLQINRWLPVICAFIFFALFGFAEEAMKNYRRAFWFRGKIKKRERER